MMQFRLRTLLAATVIWAVFLAVVRLFGALGSAAFFVIVILLSQRIRDDGLRKALRLFSTGAWLTSVGVAESEALAFVGVLLTALGILALLTVWADAS